MPKFLKILFKWLPAIVSAIRELFRLAQDYRKHRIQMRALKTDLNKNEQEVTTEEPRRNTDGLPP
ncbi:MAG: hypothetical protein HN686_08480 [Bacteroidetes bacterium]|jgi:hypothetical protein|nr:hypothetical protein [Bacteroidota bacterium]MBT4411579.1 hypothetical protein [Bacteroidota bacterium]MBT7464006.1 hypothetical protein [Bacteroidota bacterium]